MGSPAHVALLLIHLRLPGNDSLKSKRSELRTVKAQLQRRTGASVAEVDAHDTHGAAVLAAALAGSSPSHLRRSAATIERWLDGRYQEAARVELAFASFDDLSA